MRRSPAFRQCCGVDGGGVVVGVAEVGAPEPGLTEVVPLAGAGAGSEVAVSPVAVELVVPLAVAVGAVVEASALAPVVAAPDHQSRLARAFGEAFR